MTARGLTMTRAYAYASAHDAANRQMRGAGRKVWNRDDLDEAGRAFAKLWPYPIWCCAHQRDEPDTKKARAACAADKATWAAFRARGGGFGSESADAPLLLKLLKPSGTAARPRSTNREKAAAAAAPARRRRAAVAGGAQP